MARCAQAGKNGKIVNKSLCCRSFAIPMIRRTRALALLLILASAGVGGFACRTRSATTRIPGRATPKKGETLSMRQELPQAKMGQASSLIASLEQSLLRQFETLSSPDAEFEPAYYLGFDLSDDLHLYIQAAQGALFQDEQERRRLIDVDLRVGSPQLDNSRARDGIFEEKGLGSASDFPLDETPEAIEQALWEATTAQFHAAQAAYAQVQSLEEQRVQGGQRAEQDFAKEQPIEHFEALRPFDGRRFAAKWRPIIRALSRSLDEQGACVQSQATLNAMLRKRYLVNSEGSRVQREQRYFRVGMELSITAADGMKLSRSATFDATDPEGLPGLSQMQERAKELRGELLALAKAPIAEPYAGPAILESRAAAVYFHEIFGHRLEGHRQKIDSEGQTFRSQLHKAVLPEFLTVYDDPRIASINGQQLLGHYHFDDEGVRAQRSSLVSKGNLEGFLLSRSLFAPFERSNGHGRREPGYASISRQANLVIESERAFREGDLRRALIEQIRAQKKPYGLRFVDIEGGYTTTEREGPQAFKVNPRLVYRVYPDGRPDELVRGVDIVGTPLSAFETILATGDKIGVFNGFCGAESGWVPVSASSPALLLSQIEVERSVHERAKPPLLDPPASPGVAAPRCLREKGIPAR